MLLLLESLMLDLYVELHGRAPKRGEESVKPCEVFDLIGGTGTGGYSSTTIYIHFGTNFFTV